MLKPWTKIWTDSLRLVPTIAVTPVTLCTLATSSIVPDSAFDISVACLCESEIDPPFLFYYSTVAMCSRAA